MQKNTILNETKVKGIDPLTKHEVRLDNPDGDIVECMQDSNENTFINDRNIYEKWHCDVFEPCR